MPSPAQEISALLKEILAQQYRAYAEVLALKIELCKLVADVDERPLEEVLLELEAKIKKQHHEYLMLMEKARPDLAALLDTRTDEDMPDFDDERT